MSQTRFADRNSNRRFSGEVCLFCNSKAEYAFLWGTPSRKTVDYLCEKHYKTQEWSTAVPASEADKIKRPIW